MKSKKRVLVCPLDWGLGHATRCIPIIRSLLNAGAEVIIGADKRPMKLLIKEFPDLEFVIMPGYKIGYPRSGHMARSMLLQFPKIAFSIFREHLLLNTIITKYAIDAVISDNRYGLWNKKIPCVFITHQVLIKCPTSIKFLEPFLYKLNRKFTLNFTKCWIPDYEETYNLSGDLSHYYPPPANANFIGPLSRYFNTNKEHPELFSTKDITHDLMVILSGPEPQRSLFEEKIFSQLKKTKLKAVIVRGVPEHAETRTEGQITIYSHLESNSMKEVILSSKIIISRPGYSTIMDLECLCKKAILIPTPGQTEQEYLAYMYKERGLFYCEPQENFNLQRALEESKKYKGFNIAPQKSLLSQNIKCFVNMI